ncbi:hypothetical protein TRICI_001434 [Trichomonascus ciferrii]|uniref:Uncharacterized protein n=1 Tax=Trichomonascus ciferrii TaxID=44093 RepID=A0A642V9R4_9ASCO|nr:hypothetical protein TRICI_001434 [Trichomonascus ciferrii]
MQEKLGCVFGLRRRRLLVFEVDLLGRLLLLIVVNVTAEDAVTGVSAAFEEAIVVPGAQEDCAETANEVEEDVERVKLAFWGCEEGLQELASDAAYCADEDACEVDALLSRGVEDPVEV